MRLKNLSYNFPFVYWSGILFLQQLHLWLLRDLDRKISGDGKVGDSKVILLPVIVEIYGHILPHLASWYIYLSISLEHCLPNLFFKSQLSSNLVIQVKSSLQVILTSKTLIKWMWGDIFCATKPCLEFWCQGDEDAIFFLSRRSIFLLKKQLVLVVIFGLFVRFRSCDLWVYYKSYWLMVIGSTRSRSEWLWVSRFQLWNVILKTKCVWIKWGWVDFVIIVFSFTLTPHTFPHGHLSLIRLSVENLWLKSFGVSGMLFLFFYFQCFSYLHLASPSLFSVYLVLLFPVFIFILSIRALNRGRCCDLNSCKFRDK